MFRKVLVMIICVSLLLPYATCAIAEDECISAKLNAQTDVSTYHHPLIWGGLGIGTGFLFGLIGTGVLWLITPSSSPDETRILNITNEGKTPNYIQCYTANYKQETKKQNQTYSLVGGLIGSLCAGLYVANLKK
ncbi:MAG: hypothetical protein WC955_08370 [Elusimicrobiota bacterium]